MKRIYGAVIRASEEGGYWAEAPDLPGCFGQGPTFVDSVASIADGIETHLAALAASRMEAPKATRISAPDGEVVYVCVDSGSLVLGEPTISAAEAARRLAVTPARVSQLIAAGRLVAERDALGTMVTVASVEAYANSPRRAGRPKAERPSAASFSKTV
ncbi:type II toxin-antitoxin system HicB family antitoxin [Arabiibacter massiliensis]|uniref:type II toxin-antitoxin system HicB family antitoxin n=1 Tax=Arabiibacter massiliensis TaxID=1870985 RepID=UPI0009B9AEE7|nr:type II toxin-antitoxin system HicB family antitoxin [Arabiibacter massiliensis]